MRRLAIMTAALALLAGCRREDIREFTVDIPGLTGSNTAAVVDALRLKDAANPKQRRFYDGILPDSFAFDVTNRTLTLRYDSMKIAKTNIRMLIRDGGVEVAFPTNATGRAGYLNAKR